MKYSNTKPMESTTSGERAERTAIELQKQVMELSKRLDKVEAAFALLQKKVMNVQSENATLSGAWKEC